MLENSREKKLSLSDLPTADILKQGFELLGKLDDFSQKFGYELTVRPGGLTYFKDPSKPNPTLEDSKERDRYFQELNSLGDILFERRDINKAIEGFIQADLQNNQSKSITAVQRRDYYHQQFEKIISPLNYY